MTDLPVLFQPDMVRAVIAGYKTQTRRICQGLPIMENAKYKKGDRLYVRENIRFHFLFNDWKPRDIRKEDLTKVHYEADGKAPRKFGKIRPSIHVPKYFCRIWLEVVDVRIQRINDISEADAEAEGICRGDIPADDYGPDRYGFMIGLDDGTSGLKVRATDCFKELWDRINAKRGYGWTVNPFVFAYTFKRIRKPKGE